MISKWLLGRFTKERKPVRNEHNMYDLIIIQCVKTKIWDKDGTAPRFVPAKDAYVSPYFKKMKTFAEKHGKRWGVLSGKYGFLLPETEIENYNASFSRSGFASTASKPISLNEIKERLRTDEELRDGLGLDTITTCVVLGGAAYLKVARGALSEYQIGTVDLLEGLNFGKKLEWLDSKVGADDMETPNKHLDMRKPSTGAKKLEKEFDRGMREVYERAKAECNYTATRYLRMVNEHGGLKTAKKLLSSDKIHDGLARLWECRRLDLTVEVLVTKEKYRGLFTEVEIKIAEKRLRDLDYTSKS